MNFTFLFGLLKGSVVFGLLLMISVAMFYGVDAIMLKD
jgi:hypothetical protein